MNSLNPTKPRPLCPWRMLTVFLRILCIAALILLWILLPGCSTRVYGPDRKPQLISYANASRIHWKGPGTELEMEMVDHSTPTKAAFNGANGTVSAVGASIMGVR